MKHIMPWVFYIYLIKGLCSKGRIEEARSIQIFLLLFDLQIHCCGIFVIASRSKHHEGGLWPFPHRLFYKLEFSQILEEVCENSLYNLEMIILQWIVFYLPPVYD